MPEYFQTFSGEGFDPFDPSPDSIHIEDIAKGCANECRFQRQIDSFYSSAEHQVIISYMVPGQFALEALLHDATDAYLGDAARLVKRSPAFAGFWQAEIDLQKRIYSKFGIHQTEESTKVIHEADRLLMRMEAAYLVKPPYTKGWQSYDLNDNIRKEGQEKISCWSPDLAYLRYIVRYYYLMLLSRWDLTNDGK